MLIRAKSPKRGLTGAVAAGNEETGVGLVVFPTAIGLGAGGRTGGAAISGGLVCPVTDTTDSTGSTGWWPSASGIDVALLWPGGGGRAGGGGRTGGTILTELPSAA